jgi:hypothetical protein
VDQSTFTNFTGITLSSSQSARFDSLVDLSGQKLEEMLGWPLDPTDWDDQYLEIGKTKDEWWNCLSVDTSNLDGPDEVIGATRLYTWNPADPYLFIDPAVTINALKLVKNGITYKTFYPNEYSLRLLNARETYGKYVQFSDALCRWFGPIWNRSGISELIGSQHRADGDYVQVAIDADWAFEELPGSLQEVWAEFINYQLDLKRDIKSESFTSHSYTRNAHADPVEVYAGVITKYVGPNGTAYQPTVVV